MRMRCVACASRRGACADPRPAPGIRRPSACRDRAGAGTARRSVRPMRPGRGDSTRMRSARKAASLIEWVTRTTVLPVAIQIRCSSTFMLSRVMRIEGAERLVHQQDVRIEAQRARDRRRAGACRPTARAGSASRSRRCRPAPAELRAPWRVARRGDAAQLQRQRDVVLDRTATGTGSRPGRRRRAPPRSSRRPRPQTAGRRSRCAPGRPIRPAMMRSIVVLPQPEGPSSDDEFAAPDRQVDAGQREHLLVVGQIAVLQRLEKDLGTAPAACASAGAIARPAAASGSSAPSSRRARPGR